MNALQMRPIMDTIFSFLKKMGYIFYIMDPREHLFKDVSEVPDYYKEVTPVFVFIIVMEQTILLFQGKPLLRLNDSITNICQGILVEIFKIPLKGTELLVYAWVYKNWRIVTLPWDSPWTWIFCLVTTDFCFYWMHRATHQISLLWMFHEPHHSSEEFNLTVPLRISVFTSATFWITYIPMALAVPPSTFLVHYQMNIIFQYWLHSELYQPVAIIDWIFVTPTHHKVHHGRNRRCIDKNFGSYFIIWDRMFGTFEAFDKDAISYGLVHPITTFNPIGVQLNHLKVIIKRVSEMKGVNKLLVLIKGPGWSPGTSWLGNVQDIPEPSKDHKKYDPYMPSWMRYYVTLHTSIIVISYLTIFLSLTKLPITSVIWSSTFIGLSTITIGMMLDGSSLVPIVEIGRCMLYFVLDSAIEGTVGQFGILANLCLRMYRCVFFASILFWINVFPHTLLSKEWEAETYETPIKCERRNTEENLTKEDVERVK